MLTTYVIRLITSITSILFLPILIINLFYNTSARQVRHECDTNSMSGKWVQHERHECNTSETRVTQVLHEQHKCDTSATQTTWVQHDCYKNDASATRVKKFDFDNDASENIFSHPYISYIANERLQEKGQFHSKNYLFEMYCSHAKMRLKSPPQKLNFVMAKTISKSYILNCSHALARFRIVTHSNTASFSIKIILCETNNILFWQELLKTRKNEC